MEIARFRVVQSSEYPHDPGKLSIRPLDNGSVREEIAKHFLVGDEVVMLRASDFKRLLKLAMRPQTVDVK